MGQPNTEAPTVDMAIANAVRLLQWAERETDLMKMERYERLADSWMNVAGLLHEREKT
jgi:hypothetical protein